MPLRRRPLNRHQSRRAIRWAKRMRARQPRSRTSPPWRAFLLMLLIPLAVIAFAVARALR